MLLVLTPKKIKGLVEKEKYIRAFVAIVVLIFATNARISGLHQISLINFGDRYFIPVKANFISGLFAIQSFTQRRLWRKENNFLIADTGIAQTRKHKKNLIVAKCYCTIYKSAI